jgi:hypothetical protein
MPNLRERFQSIRVLPMPPRIPISLPLAILRDEPGYVMRLLSDMKPLAVLIWMANQEETGEAEGQVLPAMAERDSRQSIWRFGCSITPAQALRVADCSHLRSVLPSSPVFTALAWSMATFRPTMRSSEIILPVMSG